MSPGADTNDERVIVCAPLPRDLALTCRFLSEARIPASPCREPELLCEELRSGAGAAIVDEQALGPAFARRLAATLATQPVWSEIPLIVVSDDVNRTEGVIDILAPVTNVLVLERPMRRRTVLSLVGMALRARRRQYHTRDLLRLTEADRRKNEFLATLGHELRNPLGAMRTAHALILEHCRPDARTERPHAVLDRQLTHLARMVDDLLDVSRIISGKLTLEWQDVDLNDVVQRATAAIEPKMRARDQTLVVLLSDEPAIVVGDPVRLEQMVANLLMNAVKYTPVRGKVTVWIEAGEQLSVGVKDSGCGIAPDVLPRVFEPFVQESTSIARSQGGLGLGLPLVKGFAALHGGEISVTSDGRGKGCTFVVTLPRPPVHADAGGDRARAEKRAPASVLVGRRILVVEDNPDLREMLQMLLEEHGATVTVACDGQEGIDRALAHRPEIVLVDIGLPVLDGYQVATRLRQELGAKPILVAVSGFGQLEDRRQALDSGFDEHLVKPVILERLAAAVESTERRRRTY